MKYIDYVNIKQGTDSVPRFSNGNTTALIQMPFAMNGYTLQTESHKSNWFYHPKDRSLEGIRLTHQPSPWIGDYGQLVFLPQRDEVFSQADERWSGFRPEEVIARPDYLKVDLLRYRTTVELAPTERGAIMELHYEGDEEASFAVLPEKGHSEIYVDPEKRLITGYTTAHTWETAENFAMYFAIMFDSVFDESRTYLTHPDGTYEQGLSGEGEAVGVSVGLIEKHVTVRLATSYISIEQAKITLDRETGGKTQKEIQEKAAESWENYLSRIEITTENEEQKRTFYSCFYRMFLFPRKFYEINNEGEKIHYCADTGIVAPGIKYVDNGFWDTFRTVYPMYSIVAPEMFAEILEGFVNTYRDCGWLPKWPSPSEVGMMPGTLIDAVIADAAVKNIVDKDVLEKAFEGMIKHATEESSDHRYGRHGTEDYKKFGYIPREKYKESVNHTLDYVYGDFCIAQTAEVLGKMELEKQFRANSKNYKKLFDPETGFMRGRDCDGNMSETFDPFGWGGEYCEGGPWQNSFAVYHDIEGLADLYGGKDAFMQKLDTLFATKPIYHRGGYPVEIHEMTEMAAADFGQCAISNQPSFHLPYLFAAIGCRDKTEYWVKKLAEEAFSYRDDGYPGDDDNGTMAGWYVFSTLGIYPICPGKAEYLKITPLVEKAVIHTPNKDYVIQKGESTEQYISHKEIAGK